MTRKKKIPVDPMWPAVLRRLNAEVEKMETLRDAADKSAAKVDKLVFEAVNEGEHYRDIGKAAGRSVSWVQTVLRRLDVEGPRVRLLSARAAEAKRLAAGGKRTAARKATALEDLLP